MKRSSFLRGRGVRVLTPQTLVVGGGALGVLLLLLALRLLAPDALLVLTSPFLRAGTHASVGVASAGSVFESKAALEQEIEQLRMENARLTTESQTLAARVSDLTKLLGSRTEHGSGILAGIIARPPISPYDVLVVDAGTEEGVESGKLVFGAGGMPVGTVASASGQNARVLLFSAPGRETGAWVGDTRVPVTLIGKGSGAMVAQVARDAEIIVGAQVYVSGPGALPIGSVSEVITDPASPLALLHIRPLANPFSITWVTIAP